MKAVLLGILGFGSVVFADFTLESSAFKNGNCLPEEFTYCKAAKNGHIEQSADISPPLEWDNPPAGTRSFAIIVTDPDAVDLPYFDLPNKVISPSAPRVVVHHWILVNIPSHVRSIPEGAGSEGFVEGGKPVGRTKYGLTGENVYSNVFKSFLSKRVEFSDEDPKKMEGVYGDYDGGCPPWNDMKAHRYTYTIYALNVEGLNLPEDGMFTGDDAMKAMRGHVLGHAKLVGLYSTNKDLIKKKYCSSGKKQKKGGWFQRRAY